MTAADDWFEVVVPIRRPGSRRIALLGGTPAARPTRRSWLSCSASGSPRPQRRPDSGFHVLETRRPGTEGVSVLSRGPRCSRGRTAPTRGGHRGHAHATPLDRLLQSSVLLHETTRGSCDRQRDARGRAAAALARRGPRGVRSGNVGHQATARSSPGGHAKRQQSWIAANGAPRALGDGIRCPGRARRSRAQRQKGGAHDAQLRSRRARDVLPEGLRPSNPQPGVAGRTTSAPRPSGGPTAGSPEVTSPLVRHRPNCSSRTHGSQTGAD